MKKNTTPPVTNIDHIGYDMMMPGGEYQVPVMKNGGYTVTRSDDRKGKTHKVTGPDGTVKYFGDSHLGQHPKDPERKAAFYARHKKNLEHNPYFRAYAKATWKEGGETGDDREMLDGVADILSRVKDPENRKELAEYMMGNFRDEKVPFKENEFLEAADVYAQGGEMIRRADGSYSRRGMWDNIRANKGSGKEPTREMLEQERKIRSEEKYPNGGQFPGIERMDPLFINKHRSFLDHLKGFVNRKDNSSFENAVEFFDPTGVSSYDDAYQAYNDWQNSNTTLPSIGQTMDMFGAVPMLGKLGKLKYLDPESIKTAHKYFPWQKIANTVDTVQDELSNVKNNNQIVQAKKATGGAVDLNAFYNQPRYIQTNIYAEGGQLPHMAYGDQTPLVFNPETQKQFAKNNASWGYHGDVYNAPGKLTPALPTGTPMFYADVYTPPMGLTSGAAPVSGQPFVQDMSQPTIKADVYSGSVTDLLQTPPAKGQTFERNMNPNFSADVYQGDPGLTTGAMMGMGPEIKLPPNEKMQYAWTAGTEFQQIPKAPVSSAPQTAVGSAKAYDVGTPAYTRNNGTTNGLWNNKTYDALSMMAMLPLGNRGLAGIMKAGIGTAGFVGGLGTGIDNIYRGFKPRVSYGNQNQYATPEMMQENPVYEMNRMQTSPFTLPKFTPGIPTAQPPMNDARYTAAYGGEMPHYDFAGTVDQRSWGLDPDGVSRALGAASGLGMVNDVVGYNQAFNNMERNQVRAGMSDMRGVSNPFMPQGYDVLNTGPGQTQAPNLYTPVQFAGNRNAGFFEEGGEYEMTEDQLRQFLANGGEVEYL